ncbi:hypothetical protein AB834_00150 [PVC group bacterium (ex Bugula neritina AB1)]|nr:hypothetical protein AB834_00150 [PVC group bacterium (ex Bugula neritina AB1)]
MFPLPILKKMKLSPLRKNRYLHFLCPYCQKKVEKQSKSRRQMWTKNASQNIIFCTCNNCFARANIIQIFFKLNPTDKLTIQQIRDFYDFFGLEIPDTFKLNP